MAQERADSNHDASAERETQTAAPAPAIAMPPVPPSPPSPAGHAGPSVAAKVSPSGPPGASSVDKILALTDVGWDIDDQVRTLKRAADEQPPQGSASTREQARGLQRPPSVMMPTPFDMGQKSAPSGNIALASTVVAEPSASTPLPPPSVPPPALSGAIPASGPVSSGAMPSGAMSSGHMPGASSPPLAPASKAPPPLPSRSKSTTPSAPPPARKAPPPLPRLTPDPPTVVRGPRPEPDAAAPGALVDLLAARVATLKAAEEVDKVGLSRAHIELAVASEMLGDDARSTSHAEAALEVDPSLAAGHAILRRRKHGRADIAEMLAHLDFELEAATSEAASVELLAEKARLVEALGTRPDAARSAWQQALTRAPNHAAALKGLEAQLFTRAHEGAAWSSMERTSGDARRGGAQSEAFDALATHLGRMADAYASEPALAAWLHVERALILERRMGRVEAARGAFERALLLDPTVGPVREAFKRHVAANRDPAALAALLDEEARIERSPSRSARLELDAACIAHTQLRDDPRAIMLLERAAGRAPTTPSVDRRVLDELVNRHEAAAEWLEAVKARRARLRFVTEAAPLAYELRALSLLNERIGDLEAAIADTQRALAVDASDPTLVELLDRQLDAAGKPDQRVALWLTEAARTEEGPRRARALTRAASIAENLMARPEDAVRHLRAAWVAAPGDSEVLDGLSRLLAPTPSEALDGEVRSLVELYAQAAQKTNDRVRRLAYLEKVALLWEDLLGDTPRAARTYEEILSIAPDHRGAVLGLSRTAARMGDDRALARGLLEEARHAQDGVDVLALKTRAATAMARFDPTRALSLVADVVGQEPAHASARALETRLHEEAGRWELAAKSLRARIEHAKTRAEKVSLWLALAQLQEARLRTPFDALESLKAARQVDPAHPVPPVEIARVIEATGNDKALRGALKDLADTAVATGERARFLVRAAELDELRLDDDVSAAYLYAQALAEVPDDELVAERLARVLARRAASVPVRVDDGAPRAPSSGLGELAAHVARRLDRATSPAEARALSFDLACLLAETGNELPRAASLLDGVLEEDQSHVPALRLLEQTARRTSAWPALARVLSAQGEELMDVRARLGALWELASLEEWRLPVSDAQNTYARILELDPTDPGALESVVRRDLGNARRGDTRARRAVISALKSLCAIAPDDGTRLALELRLAMLLEAMATDASDAAHANVARDALDRYRLALEIDELSVTAASGLARLSTRLADTYSAVLAATSLAELAGQKRSRARYLVDAAELLLGPDDDARLGTRDARRTRAVVLLEKALDAEPDSVPAATRLSALRLEDGHGERLVATFQVAIARARTPEAIVMLGSEIARVARDELSDLNVAIDAMRRVREVTPSHVPSLLTLAELCIAQRTWPEAVDALEAVVAKSRDAGPRLTALFALASVYEKVLARPEDAERALRIALDIDPVNPRALRALLHRTASAREPGVPSPPAQRAEVADLLQRLAEVERDPTPKCEILLELATIRLELGDARAAEGALIEAVAQAPSNARAFARLAALFRSSQGRDHVAYARALATVIARGQQIGSSDARWLATLGQIEVEFLNRVRDGIAHLQRATQMDSTLYETRFELASSYAKVGANEETVRTLMAMITPSSRPLAALADPAGALSLLERALGAERRTEEALVVSELRAVAGDLDDGRHAWLRGRRLPPVEGHHAQLDRPTLVTHVLPHEGRHVLLEVAAAVAGIESKMLRADLTDLGISSRDRVGSRSGHPTRLLLDRLARTLGLSEVELVIAPSVTRTRVLSQDSLWVVVPRTLTELPEPTQLAALGRALARIALGVPWLEELPPPHIEALLIAAARQVVPRFGENEVDVISSKLVAQYEPGVGRALTRRQRKLLEELAPHVAAPQGRPMPIDSFMGALARAELRIAYLLCGDLLATIDELRALDPAFLRGTEAPGPAAVTSLLDHPYAGDVARFALTPEATALRRRVGTTWTG
jgi:tetratricopeptide (TPR) repeat protein